MGEKARYEHMLRTGEDLLESPSEQKKLFLGEMLEMRTPELLDKKVVEYIGEHDLPSSEVNEGFERQKEVLGKLFGSPDTGLKKDLIYHGTGFFKYGNEKYNEDDDKDIVPLFVPLIGEGIKMHDDPFMPDSDDHSVSLADSYMYAKWFASKHMTEETKPQWQLGDPNDYFRYYMADTFRAEFSPKNRLDHLKKSSTRKSIKKDRLTKYGNKLKKWTSSYRNDTDENTSLNDLLNGQSNIEGNFGLVLCLDKKAIPYEKLPYGGAHEVRARQNISTSSIKAIGVPLLQVEIISEILKEKGLNVEVFAMECAEMHFGSFEMKDLVARVE